MRHRADGRGNLKLGPLGAPAAKRPIPLHHPALAPRTPECGGGVPREREEHDARREPPKPVYRMRVGMMGADQREERVIEEPTGGHGGEAARLVHRKHLRVVTQCLEMQGHVGLVPRRAVPGHDLPGAELLGTRRRRAVDRELTAGQARGPVADRRMTIRGRKVVDQGTSRGLRAHLRPIGAAAVQRHRRPAAPIAPVPRRGAASLMTETLSLEWREGARPGRG